mmetsp:Transcript_46423/g.107181  ORF Transcript_46423/g.107181 Transcript_46423/m.107181 type:complete len:147 (+) Transcript_46423:3-443(+)
MLKHLSERISRPRPPQRAMAETHREVMYSYAAKATFGGKRHQPCMYMTSLCPNNCGHATDVYDFMLDELTATLNEASKHAKWVTPVKAGEAYPIGTKDLKACQEVADTLSKGDVVSLEWSHDYVTITEGGCSSSGPERPVSKITKL